MIEAKVINSRGKDMVCLVEYKSPELRGKKVILYKHGFCGNKITPHRIMVNLGHDLIEEGYTIVRFDCAGAGDSEGDWTYMTISGEIEDYKKVLHWTQDELKPEKMMVLAYSMGGLETAVCCREVPLNGILFWSPCSNAYECFRHLLGDERFELGMSGHDVDFMGDRVGKEFFLDLQNEELNTLKPLEGFEKPVYFIHGSADTDVLPVNSENYLKVLPGSERHLVEGAGHGYDGWELQDELWKYSKEYIRRIMD
ncbi:alpha/beta hydrolase [Ruminococcus sp. CLA-AA-H200]|uniref:Alpha/beta hydrolase n=1 Tax=Ruminococcus turbiniformis TaxID=2881258 RepID=A0ABS8G229_9FIRM|nr:alpha/beta hydrolase [Ruminococcus turbiniformis]MCC2254999.1 alpha/beta hydrolase [Ruminococcus turbiniformis]